VRAVALDGGGGRGIGGGFGGGRGCLIGHLGPVRALVAVRGVDAPGAGGRESVYQSLADDALAAGAYDADGAADGAADAMLLRAGGVGLVSGGDDGAVRLWAPGSGALSDGYPRGEDTGSSWACVGRAHAHGGGVCLVEVGKSSRRGVACRHRRGGQLLRGVVGAVAGDAGRRGLGRARGWGRGGPQARRRTSPTRGSTAARRSRRSRTRTGETIAGSAERGLSRRGDFQKRSPPRMRRARRDGATRGGRPSACTTAPRASPPARSRWTRGGGRLVSGFPRREPDMRDAAGMGERMTRKLRESERVLAVKSNKKSVLRNRMSVMAVSSCTKRGEGTT
jgi:hypothetical protein